MHRHRTVALAAAFLALAAVALVPPGVSTHTTEFVGSIPANDSSNHRFSSLTVRDVPAGGTVNTLNNDTVEGNLLVTGSAGLTFKKFSVGGTYTLNNSRGMRLENSTIQGASSLRLAGTTDAIARFYYVTFSGALEIIDSNVLLYQSTFGGSVCKSNSTVVVTPARDIPTCSTTSPTPATPSPVPTTSSVSPSPTPTSASPTSTASTSKPPYTFELVGKTVRQDILVNAAQAVNIRDTTIDGNLVVTASGQVKIEHVSVTGDVRIDRSVDLGVSTLKVGRNLLMSQTSTFYVADASVGGMVGCYKCFKGTFENVRAGGMVDVRESVDVRQINVESGSHVTYTPEAPRPAQPGEIMLAVSDQSLAFTHEKDAGGAENVDVKLDVSAISGRANLELKAKDEGAAPALALGSRFEKVLEFSDRNGNGAYDLSDLVLREYLVDDLKVRDIQQHPLGDGDGWVGHITYALPEGGSFALIFTAKNDDPDQTKIDVAFDDYPYHADDARLALQVRLESAHDWRIEEGDAEDRLTFFGHGYNGFFSWIHTAIVDDGETPVIARVLEEHRSASGEREVVLYLAYARGTHILHDPSIGVLEAAGFDVEIPPLGDVLVYGSTLVAAVIVLWALGQGGRRRPGAR